jgi:hypothetical protein
MPLDHVALRFIRNADPEAVDSVNGGVRYRSRRHARWAVFFDALGLEHLHEPKSLSLGRGLSFTPDFWLPGLNAWLVVKPSAPAIHEADRWKAELFAREHPEFRVWLSSGAPRPGEWHLEQLGETPVARGMLLADASEPAARIWVCGANDEAGARLVFDAIEIGTGKSIVQPRSFPADPNRDSVMRMAYSRVEHFESETWTRLGAISRRLHADRYSPTPVADQRRGDRAGVNAGPGLTPL